MYGLQCFPPSPTEISKKIPYGTVLIHFCLGVCVSGCLPQQKSAPTFDSVDGPAQNFQCLLNSLQVIFGWVTRTQGPSGLGLDPQKGGFCQIYLLPGFWGRWVVSHLFRIGTMRQTKLWKLNFDLLPTAQENGVRMRAWPWGGSKILGFQHFS